MSTRTGIILPFVLGTLIITGRSLAAKKAAMPRPSEYASAVVIFGGAGLLGQASPQLGATVAWGYFVALMLTPSAGDLLNLISGGVKAHGSPAQKVDTKGATA